MLVVVTKIAVAKLKLNGGSALASAKTFHNVLNESALIILFIFTFNEVSIYGFASLKIAFVSGTY